MKSAKARRRLQLRRQRFTAERAARRARIANRVRVRTATHVMIDADGTVSNVEIDLDRYEAALSRLEAHPHDDSADDGDVDVPLLADDTDCPLCKAIELSRIGHPVPFGLGHGPC